MKDSISSLRPGRTGTDPSTCTVLQNKPAKRHGSSFLPRRRPRLAPAFRRSRFHSLQEPTCASRARTRNAPKTQRTRPSARIRENQPRGKPRQHWPRQPVFVSVSEGRVTFLNLFVPISEGFSPPDPGIGLNPFRTTLPGHGTKPCGSRAWRFRPAIRDKQDEIIAYHPQRRMGRRA